MGSIDDTPSLVYPPPLEAARPDKEAPSLVYPAPLDPSRPDGALHGTSSNNTGVELPIIDLSAPILIVGGGPVGMMVTLPPSIT